MTLKEDIPSGRKEAYAKICGDAFLCEVPKTWKMRNSYIFFLLFFFFISVAEIKIFIQTCHVEEEKKKKVNQPIHNICNTRINH